MNPDQVVTIVVSCSSTGTADSPNYAWVELNLARRQHLAALADLVYREDLYQVVAPGSVDGWAEFADELEGDCLHVTPQCFWYTAAPSYGGSDVTTHSIQFAHLDAALANPGQPNADFKWVGNVLFFGGYVTAYELISLWQESHSVLS